VSGKRLAFSNDPLCAMEVPELDSYIHLVFEIGVWCAIRKKGYDTQEQLEL
jgi:hypothetical protein